MTIKRADGTQVSKTALLAIATPTTPETLYVFPEHINETFSFPGDNEDTKAEIGERRLFRAGQAYPASAIDKVFQAATVDTITPNTGPFAGGTTVTLKGDNLEGVTGVTFGGVAATAVQFLNDTTVTCVTPNMTAAGAKTVVVTDDSGAVTKTAFFTAT